MASVNKVILIGNLGADPEVRHTQSGSAVANLRLATNETWNDRDGNRQERVEWHSVSVWGKQAELCGQYLTKGRSVYIEGRLQSRTYTDKDGIERKVWDVVASQVTFLGGQGEGGQRQPQGQRGGSQSSSGRSSGNGSGGGWGGGGGGSQSSSNGGWGSGGGGGNGGWGDPGPGQRGGERPGSDAPEDDPMPFGPVMGEVL